MVDGTAVQEEGFMEEYYLITFESTHAAISTEKLLKPAEVTIMPVPRFISASCGISVRISPEKRDAAEDIFREKSVLKPEEYAYYHIRNDKSSGNVRCDKIGMDKDGTMIIFDLDGTLWDSSANVAASWNVVLERETDSGKVLTARDISSNMGKTMTEIADVHFSWLPEKERYELAHKCEVFENGYITEHGGDLYEGVEDTLAGLKQRGVRMSVVSNCQEGYVKAFLDSMDMWKYFEDYEEWGRTFLSKAENIRLMMERNGIGKAVYVGDIQKDSDAAHEAGIPCIWAAYGFGKISDAIAVIDSFDALPGVLEELGYIGK